MATQPVTTKDIQLFGKPLANAENFLNAYASWQDFLAARGMQLALRTDKELSTRDVQWLLTNFINAYFNVAQDD